MSRGPVPEHAGWQFTLGGLMLFTALLAVFLAFSRLGEQAAAGVLLVSQAIVLRRLLYAKTPAGAFCREQVSLAAAGRYWAYDLLAASLIPAVCFALDPIVFVRRGLLEEFWIVGYGGALLEVLLLLAWLVFQRRWTRFFFSHARGPILAALLGGALLAGAVFAYMIAVVLLPFSLIGLTAGVGALGLLPFLTGFAFFRHGALTLLMGGQRLSPSAAWAWGLAGSAVILGPWGVNALFRGAPSPAKGWLTFLFDA